MTKITIRLMIQILRPAMSTNLPQNLRAHCSGILERRNYITGCKSQSKRDFVVDVAEEMGGK